jgi:hypothetical protein
MTKEPKLEKMLVGIDSVPIQTILRQVRELDRPVMDLTRNGHLFVTPPGFLGDIIS